MLEIEGICEAILSNRPAQEGWSISSWLKWPDLNTNNTLNYSVCLIWSIKLKIWEIIFVIFSASQFQNNISHKLHDWTLRATVVFRILNKFGCLWIGTYTLHFNLLYRNFNHSEGHTHITHKNVIQQS